MERLSVTGQQKIQKLNELSDIEKQLDFGNHKVSVYGQFLIKVHIPVALCVTCMMTTPYNN